MKTFVIYTRATEEIVNADYWEIPDSKLVVFYKADEMVAVFNIKNIDGFKEEL